MYGKVFASMFEGSMLGAGPDVFAVWTFALTKTVKGSVELNPPLVAAMIGMPVDRVLTAITFLEQPDPFSRNPDEGGRRLIRDGQFQYRVVSHSKYSKIRNEDERKEYNREAKARERASKKAAEGSMTCQ
jgi:hypothetical protein